MLEDIIRTFQKGEQMTMKNEHIVYAYAPLLEEGKGNLLLIGITDIGWEYLKKESGNYLHATPPTGKFIVSDVWIVRGRDKKEIIEMIKMVGKQAGINTTISEVN